MSHLVTTAVHPIPTDNNQVRLLFIFLVGLSIPTLTIFSHLFIFILILLIIFDKSRYHRYFDILKPHAVVWIAILLFILLSLGISYSSAPLSEATHIWLKYKKLLFIPFFILLFRTDKERWFGIYGFLTAMGITLLLSYIMHFTGIKIGAGSIENTYIFKSHITQGIFISLAAYFFMVHAWQFKSWRWLCIILAGLAIYHVLFMLYGRTGYVLIVGLICLFIYQIASWRGLLLGLIPLLFAGTMVFMTSDVIQQRIGHIPEEFQQHQQGDGVTSVGLRTEYLQHGITLALQSPWIGHGTGSVGHDYWQFIKPEQKDKHTVNLHNEYLMMLVQLGIIGLSVFVYLLYMLWRDSYYLEHSYIFMAQGVVLTMILGCMLNSSWFDMTEGYLFAYFIGIFYASYQPQLRESVLV
jgi:O-antigen ligase